MFRRSIRILSMVLATLPAAFCHFAFVTPDSSGKSAKVFISETLEPDPAAGVKYLHGARFHLRGKTGADAGLAMRDGDGFKTLDLPGHGLRLVHGLVDLGIPAGKRTAKPYLLLYHPKSIVGDPFGVPPLVTGGETPAEIVPTGRPGAVVLKMLVHGKAYADGEITVLQPDGTQKKFRTDREGNTEPLTQTGRYGAWARFWEPGEGERDGIKYSELRHYATLVFDAYPTAAPAAAASRFAILPERTSSFGSVAVDGWLYIYGGHIAPTHNYSTEAVSGRFSRYPLSKRGVWEALPSGPPMQGMNLASHDGKVYRIGGMTPRNKPGTPSDNHSIAGCARFDPARGVWEELPALPEARSSHDVVVLDGKLVVAGGWTIEGKTQKWASTIAILDLNAATPEWKSIAQPFKKRALAAAAHRGKMYVIGGFDGKNQIARDVSIYDPKTNSWSEGPKLPEGPGLAFAPAAAAYRDGLWVSLSDGQIYRLNDESGVWEPKGKATARLAHRLAAEGDRLFVIGGADKGANSDLIEVFDGEALR